jgi:hypothetical protein
MNRFGGIKNVFLLAFCCIIFIISCNDDPSDEPDNSYTEQESENSAKKIIFETDMCFDVDDVGALAVLHFFAEKKQANLLAICFNEVHKDGAAAIDAINTSYGRGDIPIGIYKKPIDNPDNSKYLTFIANNYPHDIPDNQNDIPNALDVYYETLSKQPDSSVTILSVGFLNNLADLLEQYPALVESKVKELVIMGGINNDDFNFVRHNLVQDTEYVLRNWPTQIVISQEGYDIYTGETLKSASDGPVKDAYYKWFDNSFKGRSSWDQIAALYAVTGDAFFKLDSSKSGSLKNGYSYNMKTGWRMSLELELTKPEYQNLIEAMMRQ